MFVTSGSIQYSIHFGADRKKIVKIIFLGNGVVNRKRPFPDTEFFIDGLYLEKNGELIQLDMKDLRGDFSKTLAAVKYPSAFFRQEDIERAFFIRAGSDEGVPGYQAYIRDIFISNIQGTLKKESFSGSTDDFYIDRIFMENIHLRFIGELSGCGTSRVISMQILRAFSPSYTIVQS